MAITVSVPGNASDTAGVPGNNKYVIKTVTFTSGTPGTGSLTATMLGLEQVHLVLTSANSAGGANNDFVCHYDYDNETLDLYQGGGNAAALEEVTGNLSAAYEVRVIAFGR